ncbi:hypothetical protein K4F52_000921 [Lecanicillium sp. MT-2017a]|nr:hypothetical protein K4F52_000921 [Lecanicillium sp. MT-2017a]
MLQKLQLVSLALALGQANACIRVHTFLANDPFTGDAMGIEVWDGKEKVCSGGSTVYLANENTIWNGKCNEGYEVKISGNGRKGQVWNHNIGYHRELYGLDHRYSDYCRYNTDGGCKGKASEMEDTLWDRGDGCTAQLNTKVCGDEACDLPSKDMSDEDWAEFVATTEGANQVKGRVKAGRFTA